MEKDIALSGLRAQFVQQNAKDLISELSIVLAQFEKQGQLNNLLYRVDINPARITDTSFEALSELLWNRELNKVMFRKYYSDTTKLGNDNTIDRLKE